MQQEQQMMDALVKAEAGPGLTLMKMPKPEPGVGEVRIKIRKTAICGTDLHIYNWDPWSQENIKTPMIIGHEYVGEIDALGEGVTAYEIGQIVSGEGHIVCGHMEYSHCSSDGIEDEFEANEFAHYLLHPKAHQKVRNYLLSHKSSAIVTGLIALVIIIGIVFAANAAQENRYYGDYYVTTSGQKYHTKECFTISGSESAHRMTKTEYESGQYSSCSICLPNN